MCHTSVPRFLPIGNMKGELSKKDMYAVQALIELYKLQGGTVLEEHLHVNMNTL